MFKGLIRLFLTSIAFDQRGGILLLFLPEGSSIHTYQLILISISVVLNYKNISSIFNKQNTKILSFIILFSFFILYSYLNSSSLAPNYAAYKNELLLWNFSIIFLAFLSINDNNELRKLIYFSVVQILISYFVIGIDLNSNTRLGAGEAIVGGRIGGLIMLYSFFIFYERKFLFSIFLFFFGLLCIFLSGTRTVILAILITSFVFIIIQDKYKSIKSILIFLSVFIFVIWLVVHFQLVDITLSDRLLGVFSNKDEGGGRIELFELAYKSFFEKPFFGHGTGSFGFYSTGFDFREYPHNIVLELLFEYGIIGTFLFTATFISAYRILKNIKLSYFYPLIFSMLIYGFICSNTSLEISNQFLLFQAFAYILISHKCEIYELSLIDEISND